MIKGLILVASLLIAGVGLYCWVKLVWFLLTEFSSGQDREG
jgi:hypothetical protein